MYTDNTQVASFVNKGTYKNTILEGYSGCLLYCITGNVNVFLIFPNLPNELQTGKTKTLSLSIFVGMVWQTMFTGDDVSESEVWVCEFRLWIYYEFVTLCILFFVNEWIFKLNVFIYVQIIMK